MDEKLIDFYKDIVSRDLKAGLSEKDIVRKLFLTYPTHVFKDNYDTAFEILDEVAWYFSIPITSIQIVGSGKFGFSYFKGTMFEPTESDLDIAIISQDLFTYYSGLTFSVSKGFTDGTVFRYGDLQEYKRYISLGIFRPDKMPSCDEKQEWRKFFNELSIKHIKYFKNINAGIYLSETFFEHKQFEIVDKIKHFNK
jgi:hypothetical protein